MNHKRRALTLSFVAAMAASVLAVANASAESQATGHFTSEAAHTSLQVTEGPGEAHRFELSISGLTEIVCDEVSYVATINEVTVTDITVAPTYAKCRTTGGSAGEVTVTMNGCTYTLTQPNKVAATTEHTVDLVCPAGKAVEIHHPSCTITVPAQTGLKGVGYSTTEEERQHTITLTSNVTAISTQFHGSICNLLGTSHTGTFSGSTTVEGLDTSGAQVGIAVTGSDDPPLDEFNSEVAHSFVTGSQVSTNAATFGVFLGTFECGIATFDGTVGTQKTSRVTIKPAYAECKGFERQVTVHMNGCAYVLRLTAKEGDGRVDVECPPGNAIETTVDKFPEGGCTVTIGPQTPNGVVDYKEEGAGSERDLLIVWTLTEIDYQRDGCEVGGTGNNGTYSGSVTLEAEDTSGNPKGIWIE